MNRLTIEQERDALYNAARKSNLDAHITFLDRKGDAHNCSEKLMAFSYRKGMPYKKSLLYCDTVDTCFYFDHDGRACVTFSARWSHGAKDLDDPIEEALRLIRIMLKNMTDEVEKWLRGCADERN